MAEPGSSGSGAAASGSIARLPGSRPGGRSALLRIRPGDGRGAGGVPGDGRRQCGAPGRSGRAGDATGAAAQATIREQATHRGEATKRGQAAVREQATKRGQTTYREQAEWPATGVPRRELERKEART